MVCPKAPLLVTMSLLLVAAFSITACLGPNPLLEDCGETWVIEVEDAWAKQAGKKYWTRICAEWEYPVCTPARGELCLNVEQANDLLTNPDSLILETLRLKAITACKQVAIDEGAIMDTCEHGLGEPFYDGRCPLRAEQCAGGVPLDTGGESGESGTDTGGVVAPFEVTRQ